jgi:predicted nuclease with TOPRIM domain
MAGDYDASEFVDTDFSPQKSSAAASTSPGSSLRAPSRDDVERKVVDAQQKLAELKRAQEQLERERAGLEELRRRQTEFQTGRQEIIQSLTRGLGLLEEAEFAARRDAEQMARTTENFQNALDKVQAIQDGAWTKENFQQELTRSLTTIENARMEWNSARLKLPVLAGEGKTSAAAEKNPPPAAPALTELSFGQLGKIGLAMTWPLVLGALGIVIALLLRH